ncbi:MAG: hypothetical protein MJ246_05530, partial [Clostridia bacterium]|nr:hypothetical protein [Clostridia bacterium]
MLKEKKADMEAKPFSVGFRVEHLQSDIDKTQYGKYAGHKLLDASDYKLSYHDENDRGVYTFCMCPGGCVVASSSEEGMVVTNGMSYYKRDGENTNSAVLVSVGPDDYGKEDVLDGMYYQRELEKKAFELGGSNYYAPVQKVVDYLDGKVTTSLGKVKPSYKPGYTFADLNELLSDELNDTMKKGKFADQIRRSIKRRGRVSFSECSCLVFLINQRYTKLTSFLQSRGNMKKFFKSLLTCFIILVLFAGAVFFIGWTQIRVSPNKIGVLKSKTSGVLKEPVYSGKFSWHWQS